MESMYNNTCKPNLCCLSRPKYAPRSIIYRVNNQFLKNRGFACDVTRTSCGVQLALASLCLKMVCWLASVWRSHRYQVGRKRRHMVPQAAFKSTFDQRKRSRKAWLISNGWAATCEKVFCFSYMYTQCKYTHVHVEIKWPCVVTANNWAHSNGWCCTLPSTNSTFFCSPIHIHFF